MVTPTNEIPPGAARPLPMAERVGSSASDPLHEYRAAGQIDIAAAADNLAKQIQVDTQQAGAQGTRILQGLDAAQRGEFAARLMETLTPADVRRLGESSEGRHFLGQIAAELTPAQADTPPARAIPEVLAGDLRPASDMTSDRRALLLDLSQMGLAVAGFADPTPVSDGLDGVISLFRGDLVGAGISAVSIVPFVGDLAKIGKLGDMFQTLDRAVDLAKTDPSFAQSARPILERFQKALNDVPLERLPDSARDQVKGMQRKLNEFVAPAFEDGARHIDPDTGRTMIDAKRGSSGAFNETLDGPFEKNVIYRTDNGYQYHTDANRRVESVEGRLNLDTSQPRSEDRQHDVVHEDGVPAKRAQSDPDQGGHIIKRTWGGPAEKINLVPQRGSINQGHYARMESFVEEHLENGHRVDFEAQLDYPNSNSRRPDSMSTHITVWDDQGDVVTTQKYEFDNRRPESPQ